MRQPSARVTINYVNVYPLNRGRAALDLDRGLAGAGGAADGLVYASTPAYVAVPCSVQGETYDAEDAAGRTSTVRTYWVGFAAATLAALGYDPPRECKDKLVWLDGGNLTLYAHARVNGAGRNAYVAIHCRETL